jgi:hypothetical protein
MNDKTAKSKGRRAKGQKFPQAWDEQRVRKVLAHYENQTEDEAVAEDEAAYEGEGQRGASAPTGSWRAKGGVSRTVASSPLVQAATMRAPSVFASVMSRHRRERGH